MTISQAHSVRRARIGVCHRSGPLSLDRNWKAGAIHPRFLWQSRRSTMSIHSRTAVEMTWPNLVTACWPCNTRKADLPLAWPVRAVKTPIRHGGDW